MRGGVKMRTCGNCKYCVENHICNGDCLCKAKNLEISKDDDIRFYGEKDNTPCERYRDSKTS